MLPSQETMDPKAVTRILQHSILQLCNEHVGYTNKLQILGVLCMTIDDEQHELVVKVNNTLKRVHPGPQKDMASTTNGAVRAVAVSNNVNNTSLPPVQTDQAVVNIEPVTDVGLAAATAAISAATSKADRRHGRKGRPVKVEQVLDNPVGDSEDEIEGEEGVLTVIPEAPSTSPTRSRSGTPSSRINGIGSRTGNKRLFDGSRKNGQAINGSATPSPTPSQAASLDRASPYVHTVDHSLSLPVCLSGESVNGVNSQPQDLSKKSVEKKENEVKNEPSDSYDYSNIRIAQDDTAVNISSDQSNADIFSNLQQAYLGAIDQAAAATITYSSLGLLQCNPGSLNNSLLAPATMDDGLTIKYTSTGPYTVGANGRDVSNSSKIKDIIMYNDQTPLSEQKGARIEADFMVDKLATDGRKRRRRAAEDMMTPEEVSEYIGKTEGAAENYQCKYCGDQMESVLKYIQHTVLRHQAYICHQCGKSFTTKSSLLRHRPIHTGMRRFACSICKKTFYRKDKCKSHIKRHLGTADASVDQFAAHFTGPTRDELDFTTILSPSASLTSSPQKSNTLSTVASTAPVLAQALSNLQGPTPMPSLPSLAPGTLVVQPVTSAVTASNTLSPLSITPSAAPVLKPAPIITTSVIPLATPAVTIDSDADSPDEGQSLVVDMGPSEIDDGTDSPDRSQLNTPPPLTIDLPAPVEAAVV